MISISFVRLLEACKSIQRNIVKSALKLHRPGDDANIKTNLGVIVHAINLESALGPTKAGFSVHTHCSVGFFASSPESTFPQIIMLPQLISTKLAWRVPTDPCNYYGQDALNISESGTLNVMNRVKAVVVL